MVLLDKLQGKNHHLTVFLHTQSVEIFLNFQYIKSVLQGRKLNLSMFTLQFELRLISLSNLVKSYY